MIAYVTRVHIYQLVWENFLGCLFQITSVFACKGLKKDIETLHQIAHLEICMLLSQGVTLTKQVEFLLLIKVEKVIRGTYSNTAIFPLT